MRRVLTAMIALAGCHRSTVVDPPASFTPAASVPAPPVPKADPIVDLLHTVDCTVAVSSKVENPHDFKLDVLATVPGTDVMDASKVPWTSRKEAVIGPAGDLRAVEPAR